MAIQISRADALIPGHHPFRQHLSHVIAAETARPRQASCLAAHHVIVDLAKRTHSAQATSAGTAFAYE